VWFEVVGELEPAGGVGFGWREGILFLSGEERDSSHRYAQLPWSRGRWFEAGWGLAKAIRSVRNDQAGVGAGRWGLSANSEPFVSPCDEDGA
jgi:hypothetical protein